MPQQSQPVISQRADLAEILVGATGASEIVFTHLALEDFDVGLVHLFAYSWLEEQGGEADDAHPEDIIVDFLGLSGDPESDHGAGAPSILPSVIVGVLIEKLIPHFFEALIPALPAYPLVEVWVLVLVLHIEELLQIHDFLDSWAI